LQYALFSYEGLSMDHQLAQLRTEKCVQGFQVAGKTVTGNGFLQHMVRIMVGTLLEIGKGQREPDSITGLFGGARADAGPAVPACGLCLMEVTY